MLFPDFSWGLQGVEVLTSRSDVEKLSIALTLFNQLLLLGHLLLVVGNLTDLFTSEVTACVPWPFIGTHFPFPHLSA